MATSQEIRPARRLANAFQSLYVSGATGVTIELRDVGVMLGWAALGLVVTMVKGFRWQPRQRR